jgi:hypothetical protein
MGKSMGSFRFSLKSIHWSWQEIAFYLEPDDLISKRGAHPWSMRICWQGDRSCKQG